MQIHFGYFPHVFHLEWNWNEKQEKKVKSDWMTEWIKKEHKTNKLNIDPYTRTQTQTQIDKILLATFQFQMKENPLLPKHA